MEKFRCPCCGKEHEEGAGIILYGRLKDDIEAPRFTESYKECAECSEKFKEYVGLIGIDPKKSEVRDERVTLAGAYRTGSIMWIRKKVFGEMFNVNPDTNKFVFVEQALINTMEEKYVSKSVQ